MDLIINLFLWILIILLIGYGAKSIYTFIKNRKADKENNDDEQINNKEDNHV